MSIESGKALKDLATAIKTMTKPSPVNPHIVKAKTAAQALKLLLKTSSCEDFILFEVMPTAMVAVQLVEVITCLEKIVESVHELAALARFKDAAVNPDQKPSSEQEGPHHIIKINGLSSAVLPVVSIEASGNVVHVSNTNIKVPKSKTNVRQMRPFLSF